MGTRKLFSSLAFLFFVTTATAQEHVRPATTSIDKTSPAGDAVEGLKVYKDALGKTFISWKSTGSKPLEFLVQGSKDGKVFRAIKRLPAAASQTYQTFDEAHHGYAYFRVICIDEGGHFTYSQNMSAR